MAPPAKRAKTAAAHPFAPNGKEQAMNTNQKTQLSRIKRNLATKGYSKFTINSIAGEPADGLDDDLFKKAVDEALANDELFNPMYVFGASAVGEYEDKGRVLAEVKTANAPAGPKWGRCMQVFQCAVAWLMTFAHDEKGDVWDATTCGVIQTIAHQVALATLW